MAILIDENTRVMVQGIAGVEGKFHTSAMIKYGTKVVAGVDPAVKEAEFEGVPLFRRAARPLPLRAVQSASERLLWPPTAYFSNSSPSGLR